MALINAKQLLAGAAGTVFMTNAAGKGVVQAISGDVTVSGAGAVTIGDGKVVEGMLGAGAVTNAKLGADAVDSTKIADNAIGNEHLSDAAVGTAELAANAVTTVKITDANVTAAKADLATDVWNFAATKLTLGGITVATTADITVAQNSFDFKDPVRLATSVALPAVTAAGSGVGKTLTADAVGVLTVDGVAVVANDYILVKNQVAGADNGRYLCTTEGTAGVAFILTRATDSDSSAEVTKGMYVVALEGTDNQGAWVLNSPSTAITLDTTAITFGQYSGVSVITAGTGMSRTGETLNVGAGTGITVNADTVQITDLGVGAAQLAANAVETAKILDANVTTAKIADANVTAVKLAADVAGTGLASAAGVLSVNLGNTHNDESLVVTAPAFPVSTDAALTPDLTNLPKANSFQLFLNGILADEGVAYTRAAQTITWLGTYMPLASTDMLEAVYIS